MSSIPLLTPVVVTWLDAHGTDNQLMTLTLEDVAGVHKPSRVETYGILVRQDAEGVTLMNEYFREDKAFRGRTFVPAGMLVSVERLRKQPEPKGKSRKPKGPLDVSENQADERKEKEETHSP